MSSIQPRSGNDRRRKKRAWFIIRRALKWPVRALVLAMVSLAVNAIFADRVFVITGSTIANGIGGVAMAMLAGSVLRIGLRRVVLSRFRSFVKTEQSLIAAWKLIDMYMPLYILVGGQTLVWIHMAMINLDWKRTRKRANADRLIRDMSERIRNMGSGIQPDS